MDPPIPDRYTYARAYPSDAAALAAWERCASLMRAEPGGHVSLFRGLQPGWPGSTDPLNPPDDRHLVVLVSDRAPRLMLRRALEGALAAAGGVETALDEGNADAWHERRRASAPRGPHAPVVVERRHQMTVMPYSPRGRTEPRGSE